MLYLKTSQIEKNETHSTYRNTNKINFLLRSEDYYNIHIHTYKSTSFKVLLKHILTLCFSY